jgi:hypothetical protein
MMGRVTLNALLAEIHRSIEESAAAALQSIGDHNTAPRVSYPPNAELTPAESEALQGLRLSVAARSGLLKLVKDATAYPFFHFFSLLDGVVDPPQVFNGERVFGEAWYGLSLAPKGEQHEEMLHDEFYESYWAYKKPNS